MYAQRKSFTAPQVNNDSLLMGKNQTVSIDVLANDVDIENNIDTNSLTVTQLPSIGLFQILDGKIRYSPSTNQCGFDSIKYRVRDFNNELSNEGTVYIEITCVNLAPIALNDTLILNEDQQDSIDVFANDEFLDGPEINLKIIQAALNGNATLSKNGILVYTPNLNFEGTDSIFYSFCDDDPLDERCDTAMVYFIVNNINDFPIAISDTFNVFQGKLFSSTVSTNDVSIDGPAENYSIINNPTKGVFNMDIDGDFEYTADIGFAGNDSVTYQYCDGGNPNLCDTAKILFNVSAVFSAPIANNDTLLLRRNTSGKINILKNDVSLGNILANTVTLINTFTNITISYNDSILEIIPRQDFVGQVFVQYQYRNSLDSTSNTGSIVIIVGDPPITQNQCPLTCVINNSINILPFKDAQAGTSAMDFSVITILKQPTLGQISSYNATLREFTYSANQVEGIDTILISIQDVNGLSSDTTILCIQIQTDINAIPNPVVSPNGDQINDQWVIEGIDSYPSNKLTLFDRNGVEVFATEGYSSTNYFDGTNVSEGTYYYKLVISVGGIEKTLSGYLTVLK